MTLEDFLPWVRLKAKQCPEDVAVFAIRNAIIDLCARALVWRRHQGPVTTEANRTDYDYAPEAGQQIVKLLSATLDSQDIDCVTDTAGELLTARGESGPYLVGGFGNFQLHPAPAAGRTIRTYCAVAPTLDADTVPDAFGRYAEAVGFGAAARLLQEPNQAYTSEAVGQGYEIRFNTEVDKARYAAEKAHSRAQPRTTAIWF